jgi:hypothetical protein
MGDHTMRLLQLQLGDEGSRASEPLDFHPMMTVVSGLDAATRARVLAAITALPRGGEPGMRGLIESHGVLFDLTVDNLAMLGLDGDLDPLIRAGDLPGAATAAVETPPPATMSAEQFLAGVPEGRFPDLDAARRQQMSARETLSILRDSTERTRRDHADAAAALRRARLAVEEASGRLNPADDEGSKLLEDAIFDPPADQQVQSRDELVARVDDCALRLSHVERGLEELSSLDVRPIEVLVDALRNPGPAELVPSERANQLADAFVDLQRKVDAFEADLEARGQGTASALHAVEAARTELAEAERAMRKPNLSSDDVVELEAAHEAMLEAESKSSGRLRRGGSKRLDEAVAAQQAILDRVGFPTWSAYVMGAGLLGIDPLAEERLEQARFRLEQAEAHWAEVAAMIEADDNHRALLDQLEAVYLEAFDLLGGDDDQADLENALRSLRVPKGEVSQDELIDALAYQLQLVGLDLGPNPGVDRVLMAAEAFLIEVRALSERITELNQERDELQVQMSDARHALDSFDRAEQAAAEPTIDLTDGSAGSAGDGPTVDDLRADLVRATEEEAGYAEQLEGRVALVDAATRVEALASGRLMRLASQLAAEHAPSAAPPDESTRPTSEPAFEVDPNEGRSLPEAIEFYLLARLAAQRAVSFSGSVPLVIDDALAGYERDVVRSLLDKLERMSEAVQIIYLSDDPDVADWVASVGIQRAAVVAAPHQFA